MYKKMLECFWEKTKEVNYKKPPKKSIHALLKNHQRPTAVIDLITYLKKVRTASEADYNKIVQKNKNDIEQFVSNAYNFKIKEYNTARKQDSSLPPIEEIFQTAKISLIFSDKIEDIVINHYLPLQFKEMSIKSPPEAFPEARMMKRKFHIHVGGTNTGKTYSSICRLKEAKSGAYLGPLRLLALEIQDNLNEAGVPCSLVTGEERDILDDAHHVSSTVEMANTNINYEVVVIDECQMLGDRWRGGHWARAIMGMKCEEIHLCTAPEALEIIKSLINSCGDEYEVFQHERMTPLTYEENQGFVLKKDIKPGDALIVFSRKKVLALAAELQSYGISASVIYGALPYNSRKNQMERFIRKETQVVIATDAIGMGLNLPIKRIIFMEVEKFDGEEERALYPEEIKQIAGRAGRRGIYDEGFVTSIVSGRMIKKALNYNVPQIDSCYLNFPETLLSLNYEIEDILKKWYAQHVNDNFEKQDISIILKLISLIKRMKFTKQELYALSTIAFDDKNEVLVGYWLECCQRYKNNNEIKKPILNLENLYDMETSYKLLDLYFAFCQKMQQDCDEIWIKENKIALAEKINKALIIEMKQKGKLCKTCKKPLPWNFPHGICDKCYRKRHKYFDEDFF